VAEIPPDYVERVAKTVADLYGEATAQVLRAVARRLARGIDEPGWAEAKLLELLQLRTDAQQVVNFLGANMPTAVEAAVSEAAQAGAAQALRDLSLDAVPGARTNTAAVEALARQTISDLSRTHLQILRSADDIYRGVIAETAGGTVTGAETRRQSAQRALNRYARQGVTGFRDRAGRNWSMETYAEMSTRTASGRAMIEGSLDTYAADGRDLVIVSNAPEECKVCRPFEGKLLSISGARVGERVGGIEVVDTVRGATSAGLFHANCFPGDVQVSGGSVRAADTRWYEGELVVIHTAGGDELPVTPNHPVLTSEGWVAAGALNESHQLVRHLGAERMHLVGPDDQRVPSQIGQVASALRQSGAMVAMSVPASAEQFHGDGLGGHVDVVLARGLLSDGVDTTVIQPCGHRSLVVGGMGLSALLAERSTSQVLVGAGHATHGVVSGGDLGGALLGVHALPLASLGLAPTDLSATDLDPSADARLADAEGGRQLVLALAGSVALDQVIDLRRREFHGHVYNLQTADGWYTANGIVVHNCRHRLNAYIEGLTRPMTDTADPDGDRLRQRQRALERRIRAAKAQIAAAEPFGPGPELDRVKGTLRKAQADMREFISTNDRKRVRAREQLGAR
jgi:hypothetical protein